MHSATCRTEGDNLHCPRVIRRAETIFSRLLRRRVITCSIRAGRCTMTAELELSASVSRWNDGWR